ncbi:hypothetical protein ACFOZ0_34520 [Streptomyces yaanensis]|uniref:Lipoprotein n=1 Tax=Streptomyces yaanensis TaxID=1142239 RepID=A0ABV7SN55_9ACTN|nr:hypothetical protein [Streptomyces sp. CGMCC 4.7035]WNB97246.1 hypothetical protein Q2K21_03685 [Streptomyces sp. CGMCC 4.7035]
MRSTAVRRTALAASAAALALLATACGGSGSDDGKGEGGKAEAGKAGKAASAAPAAEALTAAELKKAALVSGDVKSGTVTDQVSPKDFVKQNEVKADDEACAALAYVQSGTVVGKPSATVQWMWVGERDKSAAKSGDVEKDVMNAALDVTSVRATLAAYADGGAEKAMAELGKAADSCAGGFAFTTQGEKVKELKVAETKAPEGADEALALTLTIYAEGTKAPLKVVVARKGSTIAYFPAVNLASVGSGKDFDYPTDVIQAQLTKLG